MTAASNQELPEDVVVILNLQSSTRGQLGCYTGEVERKRDGRRKAAMEGTSAETCSSSTRAGSWQGFEPW
jgi:hypothetical protein